ncbi:MAG: hypothetical protein CMC76_05435 [Flavobacteriaceae bacterium]|nr:hypothetical protein [Flavobacteriaceae bacterium]|tara:strand:- start:647 stop:844 length:198 start_codon:yes stop_codon:yes gene_type:complete
MNFLYFDPGLGAMIIQTIIAAVAGVVLFSKNLMHKIKVFLGLTKNSDDDVFEDIDVKEKDSENSK